MINIYRQKLINDFKADVIQRAEETKKAWSEERNIWMNRWVDLKMADDLAKRTNANAEELVAFINEAYYGK